MDVLKTTKANAQACILRGYEHDTPLIGARDLLALCERLEAAETVMEAARTAWAPMIDPNRPTQVEICFPPGDYARDFISAWQNWYKLANRTGETTMPPLTQLRHKYVKLNADCSNRIGELLNTITVENEKLKQADQVVNVLLKYLARGSWPLGQTEVDYLRWKAESIERHSA